MTNEPKLCRDCKHSKPLMFFNYELAECNAPQAYTEHSLLSGKVRRRWNYCAVHRQAGDNLCGPEGKWFEERKPIWLRVVETCAK